MPCPRCGATTDNDAECRCVSVEIEREDDGRWIAEVPKLPGVMAYGKTQEEATSRVKALAGRVLSGLCNGVPQEERLGVPWHK